VQTITDNSTNNPVPPAQYDTFWTWQSFWATSGSWQVVAGWPNAAILLAEVPLLVHAVGLLTAHYATLGRDLALAGMRGAMETVPMGYEEAIAPYRLMVLT